MYNRQQPTTLTKHIRNGLLEEQHFGFVIELNKSGKVLNVLGDSADEPFYLRSCAKPLQACVIMDYELDLTPKEIALACGSNAGEKCHYETALNFAGKFNIKEKEILCGIHKPLSPTAQKEMLMHGKSETVFHNNCIGKHLTMLALCKKLGFSTDNYDKINHPIQQIIIKKVKELCQTSGNYPMTKDGCGVPILSMPLKNIIKGFLNLFCNPFYEKITESILKYPYIFGGENRTDTKIISETGLIAKVGAGGLCVVINPNVQSGFIVKISDCDMKARELVTCDYINKLGWASIETDHTIKTLSGEVVGSINTVFSSDKF